MRLQRKTEKCNRMMTFLMILEAFYVRDPKYTKPRVYRVFFQYGVHAAIRNFCPEAFYVRILFSYHVVNSHRKGVETDQEQKFRIGSGTWKLYFARVFEDFGPGPAFFRPRDPDPPRHSKFQSIAIIKSKFHFFQTWSQIVWLFCGFTIVSSLDPYLIPFATLIPNCMIVLWVHYCVQLLSFS